MTRLAALVLLAAALPGCAANYAVFGSTFGAAPVATGTSVVVNGGLVASISLGASAANVLAGVGIVALLAAGNGLSPVPPPPMREDRTINEQDCTAPIVNLTANLKCR
jgi:hypothetical protein